LGRKQSDAEANRRIVGQQMIAFGTFLIVSILYLIAGGEWWIGILGVITAFTLMIFGGLSAIRYAYYIVLVDGLIKKILKKEIADLTDISKKLDSIEIHTKGLTIRKGGEFGREMLK